MVKYLKYFGILSSTSTLSQLNSISTHVLGHMPLLISTAWQPSVNSSKVEACLKCKVLTSSSYHLV